MSKDTTSQPRDVSEATGETEAGGAGASALGAGLRFKAGICPAGTGAVPSARLVRGYRREQTLLQLTSKYLDIELAAGSAPTDPSQPGPEIFTARELNEPTGEQFRLLGWDQVSVRPVRDVQTRIAAPRADHRQAGRFRFSQRPLHAFVAPAWTHRWVDEDVGAAQDGPHLNATGGGMKNNRFLRSGSCRLRAESGFGGAFPDEVQFH
jgi:hypothetical protein